MSLQEALETAITFEHRVRDHYTLCAARVSDPKGQEVFRTLAREEQGHVDYLVSRLEEWKRQGRIEPVELASILPPSAWVQPRAEALAREAAAAEAPATPEIELLKQALELERRTSAFYEGLFSELSEEHRALFRRFMEIEQGHVTLVQAEIDALAGHGHWFDFMEFRLEQ